MKFRYLSILTLPVILIAYIALPAVPSLVLGYEPEQFDHKSIENLEQQNPSLIFLGNSILDTRIDQKRIWDLYSTLAVILNSGSISCNRPYKTPVLSPN